MFSNKTTVSKQKKRVVIVSIILAVLLFLFIYNYLFGMTSMYYDDIEITYTEKDGNIYFEYMLTDKGGFSSGGLSLIPVVYDYDYGIRYHYYCFDVAASRWNIWFYPAKTSIQDFILDEDGNEIHSGKETDHYTKEELLEHPGLMDIRYIRVYYLNPDGTLVLLWEHPDAELIIERTQAEIESPEYYLQYYLKGKTP